MLHSAPLKFHIIRYEAMKYGTRQLEGFRKWFLQLCLKFSRVFLNSYFSSTQSLSDPNKEFLQVVNCEPF